MSEREIQIISTKQLTDEESRTILSVSLALSGVRMDLDLQDITNIVVELHNDGAAWDEIGLSILGAQKTGESVH